LATPNLRGGRIDFDNVNHITQWRFDESPEIQLREQDVLLVKDGSTLGISSFVRWLPAPTTVNGSIAVIRPGQSLEGGYLFYCINGQDFQRLVWLKRAGLGVPHLFQADLREFQITLPPKHTQRRIATILTTLDEVIEATEKLVEKHQQIKAGLMHDLFTRGLWTRPELARGDHKGLPCEATAQEGQLRPPPEEAPGLYQDSPLGLIPKSWGCKQLAGLLANTATPMRSGPFGSALLKDELVENGIPLLGIDNVFVERFEPTFRRFVSGWKFLELSRYAVFTGDVVITIMGTVGRCCVIPEGIGRALSSKHLWTMTFDSVQVLPELVCWQLNHAGWVKDWFLRQAQGAVMEAIQSSTLRTLRLPVPPIAEQHQILARYRTLSDNIDTHLTHLTKLRQQKQGLMHDLLTGRVRADNSNL
jgi:type I restriction enzyme S subunit